MTRKTALDATRMAGRLLFTLALAAVATVAAGVAARLGSDTPAPVAQAPAPGNVRTISATAPGYLIRRSLRLDDTLEHGDYAWDDTGVPEGRILITVDIENERLSVYRAGYEIGTAVILYGADEKPTPLGAFTVTEKKEDHVSNLYDAPMPYMMRLTNDGITIHGANVDQGWATNGCVGLPLDFARLLFNETRTGDLVLISDQPVVRVGQRVPLA